jgi:hypothetical protein
VAVETALTIDACRLSGAIDTDAAAVTVDFVDVEASAESVDEWIVATLATVTKTLALLALTGVVLCARPPRPLIE